VHRIGRDTQDVVDNFPGPTELRDDLFVGQGSEGSRMTLGHALASEEGERGNGARTNDKRYGLERMLISVVHI
jgi:hypothetical protein